MSFKVLCPKCDRTMFFDFDHIKDGVEAKIDGYICCFCGNEWLLEGVSSELLVRTSLTINLVTGAKKDAKVLPKI